MSTALVILLGVIIVGLGLLVHGLAKEKVTAYFGVVMFIGGIICLPFVVLYSS